MEELQNMGRNCKLVNGQLIIPKSLHSHQLDIEKNMSKTGAHLMWYLKYQGLGKEDKGELFNGYRVSVMLDTETNKVLNIYIIAIWIY